MRRLKKLLAMLLSLAMIMTNMTSVFAWHGDSSCKQTKYSHVAIAVYTEDGGYYLAEKPHIYTEVEEKYCTRCEELEEKRKNGEISWFEYELGKIHFCSRYQATRTVTQEISLGNVQNSQNNGREYQSGSKYRFTTDTVFTVKAVLTKNGTDNTEVEFTITDVANYKNSGKSFYEYCRTYYCDGKSGIDMKLTYEEIIENFFDVKYDVEGDLTAITDTTDYKTGDQVTISSEVPHKDGSVFVGWKYDDKLYQAGDTITMPEGGVTFKAEFASVYGVTYELNGGSGNIVDENQYRVNAQVTVTEEIPVREGYKFEGWSYGDNVYKANEVVSMLEGSLVFIAKWTKQYTVTYKVDGKAVYTKVVDEGTNISDYNEYKYDLKDDSKNLSAWTLETTDANLSAIDKDVVVTATTSVKTFTVTYTVDGVTYETIPNVAYGTEFDVNSVKYDNPAKIFSGWTVASGNAANVISDVVITGTTQDKYFTVTYKVDGKVVKSDEKVKYGDKVEASYDFEAKEGFEFSGWSVESGDASNATSDIVFTGTTSIKTFTVTFLDENGNVISNKTYDFGSQADTATAPKKADYTYNDESGAARLIRYSFSEWVAEGEYSLDDLNSVKQDMTFTASYKANEVKTMFYVLNRGCAQPEEPGHYENTGYSKGYEGTISAFVAVCNDDEKVAANIVQAPSNDNYGLKEGEYIKWYVIKSEWDGWHVDGIIAKEESSSTEEEPTTEEPTTEESTTEEPTTEESTTEEPTTEESTTEEPTTEETTTEEPTTEEPTTQQQTTPSEPTTEEETTTAPVEEDVEIDVPFAPGQPETPAEPETTTEPESETPEEEDVDLEVPFAGPETGDSTKYAFYLALLLGAAVGGTVAATRKKKEEN